MVMDSKKLVAYLLSLVGSTLFTLYLSRRGYFSEGIQLVDVILISVLTMVGITIVFYAKFREINSDLNEYRTKLDKASEMLKRAEDLVDIKSDIKELKRRLK